MTTKLLLLALFGAPCCGGCADDEEDEEEEDGDTDVFGDTDDVDPGTDCGQDGVTASVSGWTLPGGFPELTFPALADTSSNEPTWGLADLGGDGASDLVLTRWDTSGVSGLGTTSWLVYENEGNGFGASPIDWSIPAGYPELTYQSLADTSSSAPTWGLVDLDGDGLSDLVIARYDDGGVSGLGTTRWLVHLNTGTGFAASATNWSIPAGYPDLTFASIYDTSSSAPTWGLSDLDGDDDPDLVVTRYDDGGVSGLGSTTWLVYENDGAGFSGSASSWALPQGYPELTFQSLADASSSEPAWGLTDLDGDGLTDLIVTRYDAGGVSGLGSTTWLHYVNDGAGFAGSAGQWALPQGFPDLTFPALADASSAEPTWALSDLDGDGRPDLVVNRYDTAGVEGLGSTLWLRYGNDGTRFSTSASQWALPGGYPELTFPALADTTSNEPTWGLTDLDGDDALDIVVTRFDSAGVEGLGSTTWLVHHGACR